jgi:hypothetical protein
VALALDDEPHRIEDDAPVIHGGRALAEHVGHDGHAKADQYHCDAMCPGDLRADGHERADRRRAGSDDGLNPPADSTPQTTYPLPRAEPWPR